jgi:hypothetical protein
MRIFSVLVLVMLGACELDQVCDTDANCPSGKVCVASLCVAPSVGEGEGGDGEGESPLNTNEQRYVDAYIDAVARCEAQNGEPIHGQRLATALRFRITAELSSPDVDVDAARLPACVEALGNSCDASVACAGVQIGTRAAGEPCNFGVPECASSRCESDGTSDCGVCAEPLRHPGLGELCDGAQTCADGLDCRFLDSPQVCVPLADEGASCVAVNCAVGLSCVGEGRCVLNPQEGDPCLEFDQCPQGLGCDSNNTCRVVIVVDVGDDCDAAHYCINSLSANVCVEGTCRALPRGGDPCDDRCSYDATCVAGTCVAYADTGEACDNSTECIFSAYINTCIDGTCQPYVPPAPTACPVP